MIQTAVPILPTGDQEAIQAFCRDKLGFAVVGTYPEYTLVERDGVQLHFYTCDVPNIPQNSSCYLRVTGIEALYEAYEAAGVVHPNGALETKPWGMKEFAALTPDGVLLRIGEPA